jgi:hypothetical protein
MIIAPPRPVIAEIKDPPSPIKKRDMSNDQSTTLFSEAD